MQESGPDDTDITCNNRPSSPRKNAVTQTSITIEHLTYSYGVVFLSEYSSFLLVPCASFSISQPLEMAQGNVECELIKCAPCTIVYKTEYIYIISCYIYII